LFKFISLLLQNQFVNYQMTKRNTKVGRGRPRKKESEKLDTIQVGLLKKIIKQAGGKARMQGAIRKWAEETYGRV
jgi:hypothetical protein